MLKYLYFLVLVSLTLPACRSGHFENQKFVSQIDFSLKLVSAEEIKTDFEKSESEVKLQVLTKDLRPIRLHEFRIQIAHENLKSDKSFISKTDRNGEFSFKIFFSPGEPGGLFSTLLKIESQTFGRKVFNALWDFRSNRKTHFSLEPADETFRPSIQRDLWQLGSDSLEVKVINQSPINDLNKLYDLEHSARIFLNQEPAKNKSFIYEISFLSRDDLPSLKGVIKSDDSGIIRLAFSYPWKTFQNAAVEEIALKLSLENLKSLNTQWVLCLNLEEDDKHVLYDTRRDKLTSRMNEAPTEAQVISAAQWSVSTEPSEEPSRLNNLLLPEFSLNLLWRASLEIKRSTGTKQSYEWKKLANRKFRGKIFVINKIESEDTKKTKEILLKGFLNADGQISKEFTISSRIPFSLSDIRLGFAIELPEFQDLEKQFFLFSPEDKSIQNLDVGEASRLFAEGIQDLSTLKTSEIKNDRIFEILRASEKHARLLSHDTLKLGGISMSSSDLKINSPFNKNISSSFKQFMGWNSNYLVKHSVFFQPISVHKQDFLKESDFFQLNLKSTTDTEKYTVKEFIFAADFDAQVSILASEPNGNKWVINLENQTFHDPEIIWSVITKESPALESSFLIFGSVRALTSVKQLQEVLEKNKFLNDGVLVSPVFEN